MRGLAAAITGLAGMLGLAGLPDWDSPGFRAELDQAKAGAAEAIRQGCECASG